MSQDRDEIHNKLNRETARIAWSELARFYASGAVIEVDGREDLIEVATAMATDDSIRINTLMQAGNLARVDDARASELQAAEQSLWAVVVAPWVLVQDRHE